MERSARGLHSSGARRQPSEMTKRNRTDTVDGFPNIVVSQEDEDVVSQSQEEDEAALSRPPKKRVRHLPLATEPVSSSPLAVPREIPLQRLEDRRAATPDCPRLLCFGQLRKLDNSYLLHLNRLCFRRRLRPLGKLLCCVEMTTAASLNRPSSRM